MVGVMNRVRVSQAARQLGVHPAGHKWSLCPGCGHSADRDHAAAERITRRGLTTQKMCKRNRKTGKFGVTTIHDQPVRRSLKPKQRNSTNRRDRLTISFPITTNNPVRADHRPMGTCRTDQTPTSSGSETGNTVIGTLKLLTWVQVVGRGFHRNVHATPVSRPVWRAPTRPLLHLTKPNKPETVATASMANPAPAPTVTTVTAPCVKHVHDHKPGDGHSHAHKKNSAHTHSAAHKDNHNHSKGHKGKGAGHNHSKGHAHATPAS